jgi:hypothetical protein
MPVLASTARPKSRFKRIADPLSRALDRALPQPPGAAPPAAADAGGRPAGRGHALAAAARTMWRDRERVRPTARRIGHADRGPRSGGAGRTLDRYRRTRRARTLVGGATGRLTPRGR